MKILVCISNVPDTTSKINFIVGTPGVSFRFARSQEKRKPKPKPQPKPKPKGKNCGHHKNMENLLEFDLKM